MDFLALYLTAQIFKLRFRSGRCVLSAALGGAYSVVSVITGFQNIFLTVMISVLMCLISFFGNKVSVLIRSIAVFYIVNLLLGGAMTFVFNLYNHVSESQKDIVIHGQLNSVGAALPFPLILISAGLLFLFPALYRCLLGKRHAQRFVSANFEHNGKRVVLNCIVDSGNNVTEPISGDPIIFICENAINRILSDNEMSAIKMQEQYYNGNERHKFRLIIYKTVSGSDMCVCIKPDRITVKGKDLQARIALGKSISGKEYDAVLPSLLNV